MNLRQPSEDKSTPASNTKYPAPREFFFGHQIIALSPDTIAYTRDTNQYVDIYNFKSKSWEQLFCNPDKTPFLHKKMIALPDNRFAVALANHLKIYCSETYALLTELTLPFTDKEINAERRIQHTNIATTADGSALLLCSGIKNLVTTTQIIVDLKTQRIKRYEGRFQDDVFLINQSQLLKYSFLSQRTFLETENAESTLVNVVHSKDIVKIFAGWQQHPAVWIVSKDPVTRHTGEFYDCVNPETGGRYPKTEQFIDLYVYRMTTTQGQISAIPIMKIGESRELDVHHYCLMHHNAFIFIDSAKKALVEFDLVTMTAHEIKLEGLTKLIPRCIFPDGELAVTGFDEAGKQCLVQEKLQSPESFENAVMDIMKKTLDTMTPRFPTPLQKIIVSYASMRCAFWGTKPAEFATLELTNTDQDADVVSNLRGQTQ